MKRHTLLTLALTLAAGMLAAQNNPFQRLNFVLGSWTGTGSGFGNAKSAVESSFKPALNGSFIEVTNESYFEPTQRNPKGEHHIDKGFISYDKARKTIVFRQFHVEGFINQYILVDSLSNDSTLVFESETIENFVEGGKARWTIKKTAHESIETTFDLAMPNKPFACYGTNNLTKTSYSVSAGEPKATGIGGIFFFSNNPAQTKEWYAKNLGLEVNEWGSSFEFRNANRPQEINYLQWSPFKTGSKYFAPSKKEFMINYRVQNIEALITKLKQNGVTIVDSLEVYDYGKFIHIMDAEGNKIELWEPIDSVFTNMGGKTTK